MQDNMGRVNTGELAGVHITTGEQVQKTQENVAKQVEQSKFENTELKANAQENNAEKIENELDKTLEDSKPEKSEKSEKAEKKEQYKYSVFVRQDPVGYSNTYTSQNKQYKLPDQLLKSIMDKLLSSILTSDKKGLKNEKATIPTPSTILDDILADAIKNGVDDPAQIDKIFEFLEESLEIKEEPSNPQEASNVKKLKENISKARSEYRSKTPGIDKRHMAWNIRDPLQDELKNAGVNLSDKDATDLTVNLIQSSETPVTQTVREFHDKMQLSYPQINDLFKDKILHQMGSKVKDTSKEAPELLAIVRTIKNLQAFSTGFGVFKEMHTTRAVPEFDRADRGEIMRNIDDEKSA